MHEIMKWEWDPINCVIIQIEKQQYVSLYSINMNADYTVSPYSKSFYELNITVDTNSIASNL